MFENTAQDLNQIIGEMSEAIDNNVSLSEFMKSRSSKYEANAVRNLRRLINDLNDIYDEMLTLDDEKKDENHYV
jgi:hypothetical protein